MKNCLGLLRIKRIAVANSAGMVLIWNAVKKNGKGAALSFNFDRLKALAPDNASKIAQTLAALDHLDSPEKFVSAAARFEINETQYNQMTMTEAIPYGVIGLIK